MRRAIGRENRPAGRAKIHSPDVWPESAMPDPRSAPDPARDREEADRRTAGLAAIVVLLLLLIGGLMLTHTLHKKSQLEDCLMAGRRDCDALVNGTR
jgi:hypothetical protein